VPDDENLPPAHEPMFLTGCSLLVRRGVIEQIGGLPELYFLYYEEVDWQFTGRKQGWKVMYEPASVVLHHVSLAAGIDTPVAAFHSARSRMIFVRRHLRGARRRAVLDLLRRDGVRLAKRRRWRAALASCRGIASGLVTPTHRHAGTEESPGSRSAALKASATAQPAQLAQSGVVSEARTDSSHGG